MAASSVAAPPETAVLELVCLRAQVAVLEWQTAELHRLLASHQRLAQGVVLDQPLPPMLTLRTATSEYRDSARLTCDTELVLVSLLDSEGVLSLRSRVAGLLVVSRLRLSHLPSSDPDPLAHGPRLSVGPEGALSPRAHTSHQRGLQGGIRRGGRPADHPSVDAGRGPRRLRRRAEGDGGAARLILLRCKEPPSLRAWEAPPATDKTPLHQERYRRAQC